jgi:hypothetical protein
MSTKTTNKPPRRETTGASTEYKDLPRFNALIERIRTDNEKKRRTGVKHND